MDAKKARAASKRALSKTEAKAQKARLKRAKEAEKLIPKLEKGHWAKIQKKIEDAAAAGEIDCYYSFGSFEDGSVEELAMYNVVAKLFTRLEKEGFTVLEKVEGRGGDEMGFGGKTWYTLEISWKEDD